MNNDRTMRQVNVYWISRHKLTEDQIQMIKDRTWEFYALPCEIAHEGDLDAFDGYTPEQIREWTRNDSNDQGYTLIICVHPQIALAAISAGADVGVFENGNRAPEGERPQFYPKDLHITAYAP